MRRFLKFFGQNWFDPKYATKRKSSKELADTQVIKSNEINVAYEHCSMNNNFAQLFSNRLLMTKSASHSTFLFASFFFKVFKWLWVTRNLADSNKHKKKWISSKYLEIVSRNAKEIISVFSLLVSWSLCSFQRHSN